MFKQWITSFVLSCTCLVLAGCGTGTASKPDTSTVEGAKVTLHVPGMTERLALT